MDFDYPDADEEFDLEHEDEYEILRELEAAEFQKNSTSNISQQQKQNSSQAHSVANNNTQTASVTFSQKQSEVTQTASVNLTQKQNEVPQAQESSLMNNEDLISQSCITSSKRPLITQDIPISGAYDILDFIDLDQLSPRKKRPCWDDPKQIIKLILEKRQGVQDDDPQSIGKNPEFYNNSKSITRRVPAYNFVAVTHIEDGERFYIKVTNSNKYISKDYRPTSNFLIKSFDQIKNEAESILEKRVLKESLSSLENLENIQSKSCELWVDKYRPKRYLDLLSDENINSAFLHWLRLWDKIVFDKDPTVRKRRSQTNYKIKSKFKKKDEDAPECDSNGFPIQRIALLSGPPGLGKTTLAHVVAKHAGYNVVELNASDDRGPEAFREALLSTTQMRAVIDEEKRPNCLVLDEIDGAPAASIELLMKFIYGKLAQKGKNKDKVEKKNKDCRRPIVCICNDLYAPSLRPLRSIALVISVPEISPAALAERLGKIMQSEGLPVNMKILIQLAEKSACDVRACLGLLQYTGGGDKMLQEASLGLKDMKKGLFDSWKDMLQIPRIHNAFMTPAQRARKIMTLAHQVETDRLAQGVYHNYPTCCKDQIISVYKSLQWFEFYDEVNTLVMQHQTWMLMPYTNFAIVAWHLYLASNQSPKISYPTTQFEVAQKLERNKAILMVTKKASKKDMITLIADVLPYLPDILSPNLRPVNFQLYGIEEKENLQKLINVMLDFGLAFTQIKKPDGFYEYILDPNLWDLGTFPECKVRKPMPYPVKQIVIQELENTRIRRAAIITDEPTSDDKTKSNESVSKIVSAKPRIEAEKLLSQDNVPNHLKQLNPIELQPIAEKKSRNFFAAFQTIGHTKRMKQLEEEKLLGIVNPKEIEKQKKERATERRKNIFRDNYWYEYTEGYSNAVRRAVTISDLL